MKRPFSFLWVAFAILVALPACTPSITSNQTPRPALVKLECQNASVQAIMNMLRAGRGKDITMMADGTITMITAAFSPDDTPAWKLIMIVQQLNDMGGVLHVEIEENPHPIRQTF